MGLTGCALVFHKYSLLSVFDVCPNSKLVMHNIFQVILSHNKAPLVSHFPDNIHQQPGIKMLTKDTIIFKNDEEKSVDVLLLCTGYRYNFPFLVKDCSIEIQDERVTPLYKHLIHTRFPSLCTVGICKTICPFPQFENQVRFFLSTLEKTTVLPSSEEMELDTQRDFEARLQERLPIRHAHTLGPRQWAYNDMLADMGKFKGIPPAVQLLYDEVHRERVKNLPNYKTLNYRITGYDSYEIVEQ